MTVERCGECGFDGAMWSDEAAVRAIGQLPTEWVEALARLGSEDVQRRPIPEMWSIAEYTDHVREVLFGMRFVLDSAVDQPGIDLGDAPEPEFAAEPRPIDVGAALSGIDREARALRDRLANVPESSWSSTATVGGQKVDAHWTCRHAVHDAAHHLGDVTLLREALR
jgi:hypothetical protein